MVAARFSRSLTIGKRWLRKIGDEQESDLPAFSGAAHGIWLSPHYFFLGASLTSIFAACMV